MSPPRRLVLATRRSALALAQARAFARAFTQRWPDTQVDELQVITTGDRITDVPLADVGGKGLFIKEIEQALAEHRADLAVHSLKDVPASLAPQFCLACICERADARDVLVQAGNQHAVGLADLPRAARVGTSSLRRSVQLARARPDLVLMPLRGNVDTRLRKLDAGEMDAIVIARAGLIRLGLGQRAIAILDADTMIPAPGQGAIAIECRADDTATRTLLVALSDQDTTIAVGCERGVMKALGADCKVPFGAHARRVEAGLSVVAFFASTPSTTDATGWFRRISRTHPWPASAEAAAFLGHSLGVELLGSSSETSTVP